MKTRIPTSCLIALLAAGLAPASTFAAAPTDPTSTVQVFTQTIPIPQAECQARADAYPSMASIILANCKHTITMTLGPLTKVKAPATGGAMSMAAGCYLTASTWGSLTDNQFPLWSMTVGATMNFDSCNDVQWTSVTPDWTTWGPVSISPGWNGAYPSLRTYYYYTGTNVGINYVVSIPMIGQKTHGIRWGANPITNRYYNPFFW